MVKCKITLCTCEYFQTLKIMSEWFSLKIGLRLRRKMNRILNGTCRHTMERVWVQFQTTTVKWVSCLPRVKHAASVKYNKMRCACTTSCSTSCLNAQFQIWMCTFTECRKIVTKVIWVVGLEATSISLYSSTFYKCFTISMNFCSNKRKRREAFCNWPNIFQTQSTSHSHSDLPVSLPKQSTEGSMCFKLYW